jgi:hypothetical protein
LFGFICFWISNLFPLIYRIYVFDEMVKV